MPTKEIIQAPELIRILQEAGIDVATGDRSIGTRFVEQYGIQKAPSLEKIYYDKRAPGGQGTKNVITRGIYYKPTKAELAKIKTQYEANLLKKTASGPGKVAFEKRKKRVLQLLKTKKYSIAEVDRIIQSEFPEVKGMKTTIQELAKNIKGIPSGVTGATATRVKNVTNHLNKLDKSNVKELIKGGETNINKLINQTKKVLGISENLAARRLGQLIEAYRGDTQYIDKGNKFLARQTGNVIKGLQSGKFGGIGGSLLRKLHEQKVSKDIGENKNFFTSLKKRIQESIPGNKYETDVVKNLASSARYGTSPYSIFLQGIATDINQEKGKSLDKAFGWAEKKLQAATTMAEKKQIANEYNKKARAFAADANKNLKKGQLPVRVMEISFEEPSKVIKNKAGYELFDDVFEEIYDKHGYSFKVPKDLKTVYDVKPFVRSGTGQMKIAKALAQNAPRLWSVAPYIALPATAIGLGYGLLKGSPLEAAEVDQKTETELPKPETVRYDKTLGAFVNPADDVVSQAGLLDWAAENPIPVVAGTAATGLATKKGRAIGKGALKKLAALGAPLPTAAMDAYFIGRQIEEGRDPTDIAKDPFNWLGLATMEPLTKAAGLADKSGKFASAMRLGMSPGLIRGISRFAGLPGLAISTGLTAYDQYKKYQDKEGFIYDLFNKVDNTDV
jgi:hypothetical protein